MASPAAKRLFLDALEHEAHERGGWLRAACAGDEALRVEVERLLAAHEVADTRLGLDGWSRAVARGRAVLAAEAGGGSAVGSSPGGAPRDLGPGDRVGPYTLVRELGRGGFGTVFLARQREPVEREVALKIVTLGMDTERMLARFEAERQTLSRMEHPHIARVLDAGTTDGGRPYFVMELVHGPSVTDYCDRQGLDLRRRLRLFATIGHAVQHAHQKGVIHRDLKPTNILVTEVDGRPVPKVIDFGVAKATHETQGDVTALTREGHFVGTPAYMSPEQFGGRVDLDTRSDVYSLGVVLYQLVSGAPPFDTAGLDLVELQRLVGRVDPPRPSVRRAQLVRSGSGADTTDASDGSRPATHVGDWRIPDDLDWIVMRCLEKERGRRYPTAFALARDVERFLAEEPVEAAPPSTWYRVRKLARRHRAAAVATLVVALVLVAGVIVISHALLETRAANAALAEARDAADLEARRARDAERLADERALAARRQADVAAAVLAFLNEDLLGAAVPRSNDGTGPGSQVRDVLEVAARRIGQAAGPGGRFEDEPVVVAAVQDAIGRAFAALGLYAEAEHHLSAAAAGRGATLGPDDRATLSTRRRRADVVRLQARPAEAAAELDDVLARMAEHLRPDDLEHLAALRVRGLTAMDEGDDPAAERWLRTARDRAAAAHGERHPAVVDADGKLAMLAQWDGRLEEAEALYRGCVQAFAERLGSDDTDTLTATVNLANFLRQRGRLDESVTLYEQAAAGLSGVLGDDHPDTLTARQGQGRALVALGRIDEAESLLRDVLERSRATHGPAHPDTLDVQGGLARALELFGRADEAEVLARDAWERAREAHGDEAQVTRQRARELGSTLYSLGRLDEVEPLMRQLLEAEIAARGEDSPEVFGLRMNLAIVALGLGRPEEAGVLFREVHQGRARLYGPDDVLTLEAQGNLAAFLIEQGEFVEAESLAADAVARAEATLPHDGLELATHRVRWGRSLLALERFEQAETVLLAAHEPLDRHYGPSNLRTLDALETLAWLYRQWGCEERAAEWDARAVAAGGQALPPPDDGAPEPPHAGGAAALDG